MIQPEGDSLPSGHLPPEVCIASRDPNLKWGDRYVLVEQIGEGGLGTVWKAWDRHLEKYVAIKRIRGQFDAAEAAAFMAEGRIVARLHHPNIATVFDIGIHQGEPYIVMQLVEGRTLAEAGPWNPSHLAGALADVTQALEFSHRHGVLHQDLKPENLMIVKPPGEQERVVVLDFAISRLLGGSKKLAGRVGTPGFMSPEQQSGAEVDSRSDIYGLGATFRSLLPAQPLPREVRGVINRCLAPHPEGRFSSMEETGKALKRLALFRRRRMLVAGIMAFTVVMLGFSAASVLGPAYRQGTRERETAEAIDRARRQREGGHLEEAYAALLTAGETGRELRKDILLDLNGYDTVWEIKGHDDGVTGIGFVAGGAQVVSAGRDFKLRYWDTLTGETRGEFQAHAAKITALDVSPDGAFVATAGEDRRVKLWKENSRVPAKEWEDEDGSVVNRLRFSPDGSVLATGSEKGSVRLYSLAGGGFRSFTDAQGSIRSLAFSEDGELLAAGGEEDVIRLWSLKEKGSVRLLPGDVTWCRSLAFTPDKLQLIAAYAGNILRTIDIKTGRRTSEWLGHENFLSEVLMRPGGAIVLTSSGDGTVRFWSAADRKTLAELPRYPDEVLSLAQHSGRIVAGCLDGTVRLSERRWVFGEVRDNPREGALRDLGVDPSGRLFAARVASGILYLDSPGSPSQRIMSLPSTSAGADLVPGPGTSIAIVIRRLDGTEANPIHVADFVTQGEGAWIVENAARETDGCIRGAWGEDGVFHLVHGKGAIGKRSLWHAQRSSSRKWSSRHVCPVAGAGPEVSLQIESSAALMYLALPNPDRVMTIPLDGDCERDLSGIEPTSTRYLKTWKDRGGRLNGVGGRDDYVFVFSETAAGWRWRRFKTGGEGVAGIAGWTAEDGTLEIRWGIEGSNRIRSARLPAK